MRTVFLLVSWVICGLLLTAPALDAGPWLREKGKTFSANSFTINAYLETSSGTYIEHGLSPRMTIGVDVSQYRSFTALPSGSATLFLRRSLVAQDRPFKLAYELGAGTDWHGAAYAPHLKTALSYGRGLQWAGKSGWMTFEAAVIWDIAQDRHEVKFDSTLGLDFTDHFTGMLQLYLSHQDSTGFATLAPSLLLTPKDSRFRFQIGVETPLGKTDRTAFNFGLWTEF
ncbi:MAG: hypothetical protein ACSHWZ_13550 [Sulfitobacter sp.]